MKKLKIFFASALFILMAAAPVAAVLTPQTAAAATVAECEKTFMGIPPWYRGLTEAPDCNIKIPQNKDQLSGYIWRIVLNVIQIVLVVIAYIAAFFILYGGFLYITGGNNPSQVEKARKSIFNAVIGLAISMSAVAIINYLFGIIGSAPTTSQGLPTLTGEQILHNGLNMVYFIAGVLAVVVIVIAGLMYVSSNGDSSRVTKAKNMLTYSIVGLIIVLVAFTITNFVIGRF